MKAKRVLALLLSVSMILPSQSFSIYALASDGQVAVESELLTEESAAPTEADGEEEAAAAGNGETKDSTEEAEQTPDQENNGEDVKEPETQEPEAPETPVPEETTGAIEAEQAEAAAEGSSCLTVDSDGTLRLAEGQEIKSSVIHIPSAAKKIPKGIFNDNVKVTTVVFPDDSELTEIEAGAFAGSGITEIKLPAGVTEIQKDTFRNSYLKKVTFLGNVTYIGDEAFRGTRLTSISAPTVTELGEGAFSGCASLSEVRMEKLMTIGARAFEDCSKLDYGMVWNAALTTIGSEAFKNCGFTKLDLTGLTQENLSIGTYAFESCGSLTSVELPKQLTRLNTAVFKNCNKLVNVTLHDKITEIGEAAFGGCTSLVRIILPASVMKIQARAFGDCSALKEIIINNPSPIGTDFVIAQNAFPDRSKNSEIAMKGYDGQVRDYAEKKGYTYESLYARYVVNCVKNDHAELVVNKTSAAAGDEVLVTVTTEEGYTLKESGISVTSNVGMLSATLVSVTDNRYVFRFVMPGGRANVEALVVTNEEAAKGNLTFGFKGVNGYQGTYEDGILTMEKTGQETDLIVRLQNQEAGLWLLDFQSSNRDVATISSTGRICARGVGTATITASMKADPDKKIRFKVKVEKNVTVSSLELDLGKPNRARITQETIDGTLYDVIEYKKSTLASNSYSFKVSLKATEAGSDANLMVTSEWSSVDKSVASVASAKRTDNTNTITVNKGAEGESMITVKVRNKDADKTELVRNFIVRIVDGTPRLADSKITVNTQSETGTAIKIVPVYGYQILQDSGLRICKKQVSSGIVSYNELDGVRVVYDRDSESYRILTTEALKLDSGSSVTYADDNKLYLQGEYDETGETFVIPIPELTIENKALNPTLKTTGKINLFYNNKAALTEQGSVKITQSLTKETIEDCWLVSTENNQKAGTETPDSFAANFKAEEQEDGSILITRGSESLYKKNNKVVTTGYLYIKYAGYNDPVKKKITIPTTTVKPNYQLSATSVTASEYRKDPSYTIFLQDRKTKKLIELTNQDKIGFDYASTTEGVFDESALKDDIANNNITIQVDGTPKKGKAVITLQKDTWSDEIKYTFNLKTTTAHPTVKFKTPTLVLNQLCPQQEAATEMLVSGTEADFAGFDETTLTYTGNKRYRDDAQKLMDEMTLDETGIHVSLPEGIKSMTYSFRVMPKIQYKGTRTAYYRNAMTFKVVVKTNNPEIKVKKGTFTLNTRYAGQESVGSTYTIQNIPEGVTYELDTTEMVLTPTNSRNLNALNMRGNIRLTLENGEITAELTGNAPVSSFSYPYYVEGVKVRVGETTVPVKRFQVTIKGSKSESTVTVSGKGTLNPIDEKSELVYTAKVNNVNSEIIGVRVWELQANGNYYYDGNGQKEENRTSEHFTVTMRDGKAVVTANENSVLNTTVKYRIRLAYELKAAPGKYVISKIFTVTPKQTLPTIKTDITSAYLYAGQQGDKKVEVKITQTGVPEAVIESVAFAKGTPDEVKKAYRISYNASTGVMTLRLVNPAQIVLNKKYTITFETKCRKQMENSTGRTFKLDMTVRK